MYVALLSLSNKTAENALGPWSKAGVWLKLGAVAESVGEDDVFVEVVGASGAVASDLIDHLADGEYGGGRGGGLGL